jgi:hypothetical protein
MFARRIRLHRTAPVMFLLMDVDLQPVAILLQLVRAHPGPDGAAWRRLADTDE